MLYVPPGWVPAQSTGNADMMGVKMRFLIPSLKDSMVALGSKLAEHTSPSELLSKAIAALETPAGRC